MGRGNRPFRGRGVKNIGVQGDARDKLISARRVIGDARAVIGQHVVEKVGDLRTMLAPKRGPTRGRGRGMRGRGRGGRQADLRASMSYVYKPELVYDDELMTNGNVTHHHSRIPTDSNIKLGRGGRMTISRTRGRSIDRDLEPVQPTGIPAHMRRQPSPPAPRAYPPTRQLSPQPLMPSELYRKESPPLRRDSSYNGRPRSYTPSPPPSRPQSYIVSPRKRQSPPRRHPDVDFGPPSWDRGGRMRSDFVDRPRSRSPLDRYSRRRSLSPLMRHPSPGRYYDRRSPLPGPPRYRRTPSPDRWQRRRTRTPSPAYRRRSPSPGRPRGHSPNRLRSRPMRSFSRSPSRHSSARPMESRELRQSRPAYSETFNNDSSLCMDRANHTHSNNVPRFQEKPQERIKQRSPSVESEPEPSFYTIKVSNLSQDVSQEDVEELFGDIGNLVSARLVSKGYAEVRFLNKKDAKTAIEKYDRRELDGIPMTVRMVEPTAAAANNNKRAISRHKRHRDEMVFQVRL